MFVKCLRRIVFSINYEGIGGDFAAQCPAESIEKKEFPEAMALMSTIHGKSSHQGCRNDGVARQLPCQRRRQIDERNSHGR